jgi:hypothetical protein
MQSAMPMPGGPAVGAKSNADVGRISCECQEQCQCREDQLSTPRSMLLKLKLDAPQTVAVDCSDYHITTHMCAHYCYQQEIVTPLHCLVLYINITHILAARKILCFRNSLLDPEFSTIDVSITTCTGNISNHNKYNYIQHMYKSRLFLMSLGTVGCASVRLATCALLVVLGLAECV